MNLAMIRTMHWMPARRSLRLLMTIPVLMTRSKMRRFLITPAVAVS